MFRIILSLGEGIKGTAHVAKCLLSHAWLVLMHPGGIIKNQNVSKTCYSVE